MPGEWPHWLSDGGGVVGVYTTHNYPQQIKKKKKKNLKNFSFLITLIYRSLSDI